MWNKNEKCLFFPDESQFGASLSDDDEDNIPSNEQN